MVNMTDKNTYSNQMKLDHFKFDSYNIAVLSCVCYGLPMMLYFNLTCIMTIIYSTLLFSVSGEVYCTMFVESMSGPSADASMHLWMRKPQTKKSYHLALLHMRLCHKLC